MAQRFLKVGGSEGEAQAKILYTELIEQKDPDDAEARKYLGYTDFQGDILGMVLEPGGDPIPEAISHRRGYPFLNAVITFNNKRWLDDEDDIALAKRAVARMRKHEQLLETDHKYKAGDTIRANIANDPLLMDLNYASIWRPPYLICYSSSDTLSDFDLLKIDDYQERKRKKAEMAEKRKEWTKVLEEKAQVFKGAYDEWMKRYAEPFDLKPLSDPYGGRPDYKVGVRSYEDGVPLCIWIFTDQKAFQEYHVKYKGGPLPPGVAGYFMPTTGWIFLFDDKATKEDRVFEINKQVHEGVHQLEWWFTQAAQQVGRVGRGPERHLRGHRRVPRLRRDGQVPQAQVHGRRVPPPADHAGHREAARGPPAGVPRLPDQEAGLLHDLRGRRRTGATRSGGCRRAW